jgi:altronate hydrolase
MKKNTLLVHPDDNVMVALERLPAGTRVAHNGLTVELVEEIPQKHKFTLAPLAPGDEVIMYGVLIGKATQPIPAGGRIRTENVKHAAGDYRSKERNTDWQAPDVSRFAGRTFMGYHRADGKVGTRNYWLVIPLVFCENRNIRVMEAALKEQLGYISEKSYAVNAAALVDLYRKGADAAQLMEADIVQSAQEARTGRVFPNVDGIKFLTHSGGCGGTRQDAEALCHLLAGYITNPNVAGATVLSLGCQHSQAEILQQALAQRDADLQKPVYFLEQQKGGTEREYIADAVKKTFVGLMQANACRRAPAPLSKLVVGLECGGSDGFSGISANPALGYASDLVVALGGTTILSEFPELNGVEQELINRCVTDAEAEKFAHLMRVYSARAEAVSSGFDMNPSPGNIRDGLITDAMKSAGAAKKGGTSPVTQVLDYTEPATRPGLALLCTPGNDVESTTALAASWTNVIVFTTGLGTPTGNPVVPTVKLSSNTTLATRMADLIDMDAGTVITGEDTIETLGEKLLEQVIAIASGDQLTRAELLGQDDFIPWKRGVSL